VSWNFVLAVAALDLLVVGLVVLMYKELQAVCFDEEFAEVAGVAVEPVLLLLLTLTALAVVTLIRVVGVILVIALLTIPAAVARHWSHSLKTMMALAVAISATCTTCGLFLSYGLSDAFALSVPPGPLIILIAALGYGISIALKTLAPRPDPLG
jgi:zinc transport system permease protein